MKKSILFTLLFLSLITISTIMLPAAAIDYTKIGVREGDTADYTSSTMTGMGETSTGIGVITTIGFHIEILQISGENVSINVRDIYANNSEGPNATFFGNMSSSNYEIFLYLIPANLSQGDYAVTAPSQYYIADSYHIVGTTTMLVAGVYRIVNHVQSSDPIFIPGAPIDLGGLMIMKETCSYDAYYDKVTGLLVSADLTVTNYVTTGWIKEVGTYIQTLTSTTAFNSSDTTFTPNPAETTTPLPIIAEAIAFIASTVAIAVAAAAITQRRKLKTTPL
jgi:hypothetical protein